MGYLLSTCIYWNQIVSERVVSTDRWTPLTINRRLPCSAGTRSSSERQFLSVFVYSLLVYLPWMKVRGTSNNSFLFIVLRLMYRLDWTENPFDSNRSPISSVVKK